MYYINPNIINLERIVYQENRKNYLRLDLNENPGGLPAEFIDDTLKDITPEFVSQYPETKEFVNCLSKFLNVKENSICLVNGSSEGIRYIVEAFTSPGGKIVGVVPSYAMYQVYAEMYGRQFIEVHYNQDLSISADQIIERLSPDIELLILLNPNNPIGNVYSNKEFEKIIDAAEKFQITILVDEAYMYFYDNTFIDYAIKKPHILITRTFSKLFSLGSGRLGYVVGQPFEIKMISNLCTPHNTNAYAMLLAQRIIETPGMLDRMIEGQRKGKQYIIEKLNENQYVLNAKEGNFIFIKPKYIDAAEIVEQMKEKKKILIKSYDGIGDMGKCLRVTTGEVKYMEEFLEALLDIDRA